MSRINTLKIYEAVKGDWAKDAPRAVAEAIDEALNEYDNGQKDVLATKADLLAMKADMLAMKAELEVKLKELEVRIIRWMFVFWITQFVAILAILVAKH